MNLRPVPSRGGGSRFASARVRESNEVATTSTGLAHTRDEANHDLGDDMAGFGNGLSCKREVS